MKELKLEGITALRHGESRIFTFRQGERERQGFVLRHGDGYYAYLNRCRHWSAPLDMDDGDFYRADFDRIACKVHGATYEPDTGLCDSGPCVGARLDAFPVRLEGDAAWIGLPDDAVPGPG